MTHRRIGKVLESNSLFSIVTIIDLTENKRNLQYDIIASPMTTGLKKNDIIYFSLDSKGRPCKIKSERS